MPFPRGENTTPALPGMVVTINFFNITIMQVTALMLFLSYFDSIELKKLTQGFLSIIYYSLYLLVNY